MNDDILATIAEIRHEHTNYNKLSVFYHVYPWARRKLNRLIQQLIDGQIAIPTFREEVKKLEDTINLHRRGPQKTYIRNESRKFFAMGCYTHDNAKALAKTNLASILKAQATLNTGKYDPNLFTNTRWVPLKDKYRK